MTNLQEAKKLARFESASPHALSYLVSHGRNLGAAASALGAEPGHIRTMVKNRYFGTAAKKTLVQHARTLGLLIRNPQNTEYALGKEGQPPSMSFAVQSGGDEPVTMTVDYYGDVEGDHPVFDTMMSVAGKSRHYRDTLAKAIRRMEHIRSVTSG